MCSFLGVMCVVPLLAGGCLLIHEKENTRSNSALQSGQYNNEQYLF